MWWNYFSASFRGRCFKILETEQLKTFCTFLNDIQLLAALDFAWKLQKDFYCSSTNEVEITVTFCTNTNVKKISPFQFEKQCLFYLSLTLACTLIQALIEFKIQILSLFFLISINCPLSIFSDAAFVKNSMDAFFARRISQSKSENNCPQILTSPLSKKVCAWAFCLFCYYCLTLKLRQVSKSSARFGTSRTNTPSAKILILLETQVEWFLLNLKCIYMHASHLLTTGKFNKINLVITTMLGCCLCHLFEGRTGFLFKTALIAELLKTQKIIIEIWFMQASVH